MISVTKQSIINVLNDEAFLEEAYTLLNDIVDKELEKPEDEINFELIDSCCEAMVEIQTGSNDAVKELLSLFANKEFKEKADKLTVRSLSKSLKVILIAAALMVSMLTITAAAESITGKSILEQIGIESRSEEQTETTEDSTHTTVLESTSKTEKITDLLNRNDNSVVVKKMKKPSGNSKGIYTYYCIDSNIDDDDEVEILHKPYTKKGEAPVIEFDVEKGGEEIKYDGEDTTCEDNTNNHSWTQWTVFCEPTCYEIGGKERYCTKCGCFQYCDMFPTGKHKFEKSYVDFKAQTGSDGCMAKKCSVCGHNYYAKISKPMYIVLSNETFYYDGTQHKPDVIAVIDEDGYEIPKKNYNIHYRNCETVNEWSAVSIGFKGRYYENGAGADINILPPPTNLSGIAVEGTSIMPYWNKSGYITSTNCSGYQIEYSKSSDFSNSIKIKVKGRNSTSNVIKTLEKNTTYYVRLRTYYYNSDDRSNKYSYWSDVRQIKTE